LQGVTEFLPISSSGHLVLAQNLLGLKEPEILFDVALHIGTLVAVVWVFRKEVVDILRSLPFAARGLKEGKSLASLFEESAELRLLCMIALATLVTGSLGFAAKDAVKSLFASVSAVGYMLGATGILLAFTYFSGHGKKGDAGPAAAILVGLGQGLAIAPGLSRSGTTIAIGLFLGLERDLAARFSFLISIPAILGALVLEISEAAAGSFSAGEMVLGALFAAASGYLALRLLLRVVHQGRLYLFSPYCLALALVLFLR
jgi:undecaprenyl-diphosphatase